MKSELWRRLTAEFVGTAFLVAAVVGSGIMAERLCHDAGLALLANTLATGAALVALILGFGPVSGAHFNPVVSVADASMGGLLWKDVVPYSASQILGGVLGTLTAHVMFAVPTTASQHVRNSSAFLVSEFVATFGLLAVIWGCSRSRPSAVPFAVGGYITAAYWFTSSTSFANPAVTIARSLSNTFSGIRPQDVPLFIVAQFVGGLTATFLFRWLIPNLDTSASDVLIQHE